MLENKEAIIALIVQQQYEQGIGGKGALLPYSAPYQKRKEKLGIYQGFTDYSLTGKMHEQMDLSIDGQIYKIFSTAEVNGYLLSDLLEKRDGEEAFNPTEKNKLAIWEIIKPSFMEKVNSVVVLD